MKNFKLLLATTAILSTGAILANADVSDSITNFRVIAEVIDEDLSLEAVEPLDFGKVILDKEYHGEVTLEYSAGNGITAYGIKYNSGINPGKVCFTDKDPDAMLGENLLITADDIQVEDGVNIRKFSFSDAADSPDGERCVIVGGQLHITNPSWTGSIDTYATVTVVYNYD